ncbi:hypothetical protein CHS0354_041702 [Potamilus streckersoni]|uniref:Uncharacterized protein n=1 Tax=Potamilus streckersoni TaxID=2493646 RepID=A0AAE0T1P7_9BIVA|nr:hypothetical protein CHS0354_041702 [Potamilus streckersoni]
MKDNARLKDGTGDSVIPLQTPIVPFDQSLYTVDYGILLGPIAPLLHRVILAPGDGAMKR